MTGLDKNFMPKTPEKVRHNADTLAIIRGQCFIFSYLDFLSMFDNNGFADNPDKSFLRSQQLLDLFTRVFENVNDGFRPYFQKAFKD